NRCPVSDAAQVLDGDPASGAFGSGDNLLADDVVNVGGAACFLLAPLDEKATGTARAELLESLTDAAGTFTSAAQLSARIKSSVAVRRDVLDAQVNAQETLGIGHRRRLGFHGKGERPPLLVGVEKQIDLTENGS